MKTHLTLRLILLASLLLGSVTGASAADRFNINFSMSGKTTNDAQALVSHPLNRGQVLKNISESMGIPTSNLAVVFDRNSGVISVVDREFGTNILGLLRLETDLSVGNTNLTRLEVFMKVSHPEQVNFDGSAVAQVSIKRDALGQETAFKVSGKIHVAVEEGGIDTTAIYNGVFSTSSVFTPRQPL